MKTPEEWRLYFIADVGLLPVGKLLELSEELLSAGGVDALQFRAKQVSRSARRLFAAEFRRLCHSHDCPLIINDDVQLAHEVDAQGVHLGPGDQDPASARLILGPEKFIGASVRTLTTLHGAEAAGADHFGCGNLFGTLTKIDAPSPMGLEPLRQLCAATSRPVFGIGGVDASNAALVLGAGARGVVVASALAAALDPVLALAELRAAIDGAAGRA